MAILLLLFRGHSRSGARRGRRIGEAADAPGASRPAFGGDSTRLIWSSEPGGSAVRSEHRRLIRRPPERPTPVLKRVRANNTRCWSSSAPPLLRDRDPKVHALAAQAGIGQCGADQERYVADRQQRSLASAWGPRKPARRLVFTKNRLRLMQKPRLTHG